jgi:hypothetical protein
MAAPAVAGIVAIASSTAAAATTARVLVRVQAGLEATSDDWRFMAATPSGRTLQASSQW